MDSATKEELSRLILAALGRLSVAEFCVSESDPETALAALQEAQPLIQLAATTLLEVK